MLPQDWTLLPEQDEIKVLNSDGVMVVGEPWKPNAHTNKAHK